MKTRIWIFLLISVFLLLALDGISIAETITFEPYTDDEEPYLIDGGTHTLNKMVADFGAGFNDNHFRFADMAVFWIYKFEFDVPVEATIKMDLGAEFKISIAMTRSDEEPNYVVVLEEKKHLHALENKDIKTIQFSDYFKSPGRIVWIKFEDSLPQDGWGPYLDSFTLEYTKLGFSVKPIRRLTTTWSSIKMTS